uniref:SKI-like proto-oncogene a n=1 Tax=Poecilia formosa TaxID=48698 RepID=A0A087XHN7_POEFO
IVGSVKALDLSPGLKHTLAQFTLSSQSSLGGPAAFSARTGHESSPAGLPPLPSPPVLGGGPLLVPCDSSTELTHSLLEGESISCFVVGGEKRLCLPQVLNSVLRDFSLQQINTVCDELYVYCSRCDAEQLHILKVLGILPFNAPSCGLITLTDAQRLCNALLRPGAALPTDPSGKLLSQGLLKESEASFQVEHQCLGKCQGLFVPQFYTQPEAPCIQCVECQLLFSPQKFVMHSHKSPDKRTCHWGFDSAKWPCYLQLARKYQGTPEEPRLKQLLDEVKEKFHYQGRKYKVTRSHVPGEIPAWKSSRKQSDIRWRHETSDFITTEQRSCSLWLAPGQSAASASLSCSHLIGFLQTFRAFSPGECTTHNQNPPHLNRRIKETLKLYYKKSRQTANGRHLEASPDSEEENLTSDPAASLCFSIIETSTLCFRSRERKRRARPSSDLHASPPVTAGTEEAKSQSVAAAALATERESQTQAVSMETSSPCCKKATHIPSHTPPPASLPRSASMLSSETEAASKDMSAAVATASAVGGVEDDKDRIVVEIMQMYNRQQEKLNSTLQKQLQLEMELEALRGGEAARLRELSAEQRELRSELEAVHSEQARRLGQARQEQLELESRLEQLRQQACACEPGAQRQQEAHYTAQLSELRQRLERAEADRQELQEELHREREAREKLEHTIAQLKQQMAQSGMMGGTQTIQPDP